MDSTCTYLGTAGELCCIAHPNSLDVTEYVPDLQSDAKFRIKLYEDRQKLFISENFVVWTAGGAMMRKISVESPIVDCFFTRFDGTNAETSTASKSTGSTLSNYSGSGIVSSSGNRFRDHGNINYSTSRDKVLVVILEDQIRVYDRKTSVLVVSFPIHIQNAFPFHRGIIIGRKIENSLPHNEMFGQNNNLDGFSPTQDLPYLNNMSTPFAARSSFANQGGASGASSSSASSNSLMDSNFLTLTDSVGQLGIVVSSSTTSFSHTERIVCFPSSMQGSSLSATYNKSDHTISIYHTRYLSKPKTAKSKSHSGNATREVSKRSFPSSGAAMNISTSRLIDEDMKHLRSTSNPLSFDRMASGTEHGGDNIGATPGMSSLSSADSWSLKKDIILTKVLSFPSSVNADELKIFTLAFEDREAIIFVNSEAGQVGAYIFEKSCSQVSISKLKKKFTIDGIDASRFDMGQKESSYIVVLRENNLVNLFNPFYNLFSAPLNLSLGALTALHIEDVQDHEILFQCSDGKHYSVHVCNKIKDHNVDNFVSSLKYFCHSLIYERFWLSWCSNLNLNIPFCDDWKTYVVTSLAMSLPPEVDLDLIDTNLNEITQLIPYVKVVRLRANITNNTDLPMVTLLPKYTLVLHVIREDLKLNILSSDMCDKLAILLAQLTLWMAWSAPWREYYNIDDSCLDHSIQLNLPELTSDPPNILEAIGSLFTDNVLPYLTFSVIASEQDSIDRIVTPRTFKTLRLFEMIASPEQDHMDLISKMVSLDMDEAELETYPAGIYFIFKNIMELCQRKLKLNWNVSNEELKLIGRRDLLPLEADIQPATFSEKSRKRYPQTTRQIVSELSMNESLAAWDNNVEADKFHVTRLIFSQDRRFYELTRLLQTSKVQVITYDAEPNMDDHEKLLHQRAICSKIALRTLTTPIGRGAVFNSSRKPLVTEGFPIPKMNFNTLIMPDNINVSLEIDVIPSFLMDCGYFHNGASAGLSVSKDFTGINGSWVVFNRPPELNPQHAGFLLGLGLNGHLKNLEEWHIYNYLGPKHVHTSIGLLIGMAASLRGTMDIKLTKVLSVHVVAFLPPGSTNLNVQLPVQTAGLIGIGLVYLGTQHRRMSEVLLAQISCILTINDKKIVSEGYQLAAGFALGYVNLGKGDLMIASNDSHIIDNLISYGTSFRDVQTLKELDKSCSGAVMALTFMFLKTNNREISEKLSLPKTTQLLEYVRPDLLMLRCLAKNMIMWNSIEPNEDFVNRQIPACVSKRYSIETIEALESDILPYVNILTGSLLSISICYASTGNLDAKRVLLHYFDLLLNLSTIEPDNYDSKITIAAVRNAINVVILGLSIIMAGTGDLDIMRRLRYMQGLTDEYTKYGDYMAVNMSLGFLFLGGGQQAFNTNDDFAIAALITSIYPMFGAYNYKRDEENDLGNSSSNNTDSSDLHLQALRHFWALAIENRCLIVREVDSEKPVSVDVDVLLKNNAVLKVPSPCLLPDLNLIHRITVSRNNLYFPVEFDLMRSSKTGCEKFKKSLTLYVDKCASYKTLKLGFEEMVNIDEKLSRLELGNEMDIGISTEEETDGLKGLSIFEGMEPFEKDMMFEGLEKNMGRSSFGTGVFDFKFELERMVRDIGSEEGDEDALSNLRLIFNYVDSILEGDTSDGVGAKRKRRKTRKYLGANGLITDDFFGDDEFNSGDEEGERSGGLSFLNVEFVETLKKELFSKFV